jgi:hypothetical protein
MFLAGSRFIVSQDNPEKKKKRKNIPEQVVVFSDMEWTFEDATWQDKTSIAKGQAKKIQGMRAVRIYWVLPRARSLFGQFWKGREGMLEHGRYWSGRPASHFAFRRIGA